MPDFDEIWNNAKESDVNAFGWSHTPLEGGMIGAVRSQLTADPRLIVGHIVPEDPNGRERMLKLGGLRG
jgi:hypothetical protein